MDDDTKKEGAGTGVGAATGAAVGGVAAGATTGALAGGVTGPVGAAIGAAVGAVAGAVMGHKAADPDQEDAFWRENHSSRPYIQKDVSYDHYSPAYRAGVDSYSRNPERSFEDVEPELRSNWASTRGRSSLEWDRVSNRAERAIPGDSDGDGR